MSPRSSPNTTFRKKERKWTATGQWRFRSRRNCSRGSSDTSTASLSTPDASSVSGSSCWDSSSRRWTKPTSHKHTDRMGLPRGGPILLEVIIFVFIPGQPEGQGHAVPVGAAGCGDHRRGAFALCFCAGSAPHLPAHRDHGGLCLSLHPL